MTLSFRSTAIAVGLLSTLSAAPALAGSAADSVTVQQPFVRMVPPGIANTGAFMTLKNADGKTHRLVKADSPVAKAVELHTHIDDGGVMKMRPVKDIEMKANGEAVLKPGSLHIMLIGLKQELKDGDLVPMALTFEDGSVKKLDAPVQKFQTEMKMDMKPGTMPMHDHSKMH